MQPATKPYTTELFQLLFCLERRSKITKSLSGAWPNFDELSGIDGAQINVVTTCLGQR
jgi:hypothetical protein